MDDTVITIQKHFSFFFTNGTQSLGAVGTHFLVAGCVRQKAELLLRQLIFSEVEALLLSVVSPFSFLVPWMWLGSCGWGNHSLTMRANPPAEDGGGRGQEDWPQVTSRVLILALGGLSVRNGSVDWISVPCSQSHLKWYITFIMNMFFTYTRECFRPANMRHWPLCPMRHWPLCPMLVCSSVF